MSSLKIKRGSYAKLAAAAIADQLKEGEPYLITDQGRIAIGTSTSTFEVFAKLSEASGGAVSRVFAIADQTNNNAVANTLLVNSKLLVPIAANQTVKLKYFIKYTAAAATTGCRFVLQGPTIGSGSIYGKSQYTLTATSRTFNNFSAYNVPPAANTTSLIAGNIAEIEAIVNNGATAGNINIAFASEVASSAIVLKAGSFVEYEYL